MASNPGVGKKISHLVAEGKPQKQAVAEALSMQQAGRLDASGNYEHVMSHAAKKRGHK